MLEISFFGVRGSTPCSCDATREIGGNTACVVVEAAGCDPIILDMGTGLRYYGEALAAEGIAPFRATALVSHLHWDHIQGIPFFKPLLRSDCQLTLVGPPQNGSSLSAEIGRFVQPPLFPVPLNQLPGVVEFIETEPQMQMAIGDCTVTVAEVPHCGVTNAYRIDNSTGSLAYLSDHQQPLDGSMVVDPRVVELCKDVDVLIHDAQYSAEELQGRRNWGHSTPQYALEVAIASGAKRLILFHHDPTHSDQWVRQVETELAAEASGHGIEVLAAYEGLRLTSGSA